MTKTALAALGLAFVTTVVPVRAQFRNGSQTVLLNLPRVSQRSVLTQRIGLTDVTIVYHRPLVGGRTIFGDMVPYDRVWRAGANDNTTIEFTDPVSIDGHSLPAGRYGLHMIPGKTDWTVIFSKNSTSWGSFSYDPKEDALRVTAKPADNPFHEALTFEFTDLTPERATIALEWEDLAVPFSVAVETKSITLESLRHELRHLPGFQAEAWYDAALYCLDNQFNYDEALEWIDHAIAQSAENFENLDLKSQILEKLGRPQEAAATLAKALALATPEQMYRYGDRLLREKKLDQARQVFAKQTLDHPDVWRNWYGLARVQVAQGDRASAKKSLEEALSRASQPAQKEGIRRMLDRLAAGQAIS